MSKGSSAVPFPVGSPPAPLPTHPRVPGGVSPLLRRGIVFHLVSSAGVLILHGLSLQLSDLVSVTAFTGKAFAAMGVYAGVSAFPILAWAALGYARAMPATAPEIDPVRWERILKGLFLVSLVGVLLHWDAKWRCLNGESFTTWARLRDVWIHPSVVLPWWHRLESVLGHLMSSAAHAGLFYSAWIWTSRGPQRGAAAGLLGFSVLALLYALAIVSRSFMLVDLIVLAAGVSIAYVGKELPWRLFLVRGATVVGTFGLVTVLLVLFLFGQAASGQRTSSEAPSASYREYENGFFDEIPVSRLESPGAVRWAVRRWTPRANSVMLYLNHGVFNFAYVLSLRDRGPGQLFACLQHWARLLRINPGPEPGEKPRVFGRGGLTLSGAAFHDFGWAGVFLAALGQGTLYVLALILLSGSGFKSVVGWTLFVGSTLTTGLSGMFVAASLAPFPFVLFAIFTAGGASVICAGSKPSVESKAAGGR